MISHDSCHGEGDDNRVPLGIAYEDDFLNENVLHGSFDKACYEVLLLYNVSLNSAGTQ